MGYDTEVQFTVNQESYVFEKLEAVVRNSPETSRSESVQFTEVESDAKKGIYKINVKVLEQVSDIMIRPVCKALPKISGITPALDVTGCLQDSEITISFNKKMDTESFKDENGKIKGITITTSDGEDLSEYFDEAIFDSDNKSLTILPLCLIDDTKYLLPPDGTKNNLNIEVSYTFINVKDADGLEFTENGTHSYKINKNFSDQESVTVVVQNPVAAYGSFLSSGEKTCIVRFGFDIEFTLNKEAYIFQGFEAVSQSKVLDESFVSFENKQYDYETGIYRARVRVYKSASDIIIRPNCQLVSNADVTITQSEKGTKTISPADKTKVQSFINREYSITFSPDEDYEFIRWELYDIKTDSSITNGTYVKVDDPAQPSTNYEVTQIPDNGIELALRPVVAERPQIISNTPQNSGILKDSSIQVLFDHDMDEGSIYYSDDELESLIAEVGEENLLSSAMSEGKFYGYKKDGLTYYKNIVLTNNKTGVNLNDKYEEPFFENKRTLTIPASKVEGKVLDHYTQILVTIEKGFFYKEPIDDTKKREITLRGSKKWMYQVNNKTDSDPLVFLKDNGKDLFELKLTKDGNSLTSESSAPEIGNDGSKIKDLNFAQNTQKLSNEQTITTSSIYLDVILQDVAGGSGPSANFTVYYERIKEKDYINDGNGEFITGNFSVPYTTVASEDALYNGNLELKMPKDGLYRIWFDFTDRSKNHFYYPDGADEENSTIGFYVVKDTTPTSEVTQTKIESGSGDTDFKVSWEIPQDLDYKETVVTVTGAVESTTTVQKGTKEATISGIENGKIYEIKVSCVDYAGIKTEGVSIGTFLTGLKVEGTPTFSFLDGLFKTEETASSRGLSATAFYSDGSSKIVSGNAKVAYPQNIKKEAGFSYTEGDVTKIGLLAGEYYVAKNDVLHTNLSAGDTTGSSATFGNYPQSSSGLSGEDAYTSEYIYKEWYLGKDGYFYAKNGENYYKVEPVHWRVLESERVAPYEQKYLLLASSIMEGGIPYYVDRNKRYISSETIETVNYYYSTVRAFLRGEYQSDDTQERTYEGKGFLQIAFTEAEREKIWEITLLKENDFLNSNYGFNTNDQEQDGNRAFAGTAWACSKGLKGWVSGLDHYTYWDNNHYAWTQPNSSNSALNILGPNGAFGRKYYSSSSSYFSYYSEYIDETNIGILPAITVYGNAAY